jgi:hypothetical protein
VPKEKPKFTKGFLPYTSNHITENYYKEILYLVVFIVRPNIMSIFHLIIFFNILSTWKVTIIHLEFIVVINVFPSQRDIEQKPIADASFKAIIPYPTRGSIYNNVSWIQIPSFLKTYCTARKRRPNAASESLRFLNHIRKVLGSNTDTETGYPDSGFS